MCTLKRYQPATIETHEAMWEPAQTVTNYGIQYGRYNSILGHNVLHCAKIYKSCARDIISGSVNSIVNNYVHSLVEDCQLQAACFVHELILIRYSAQAFPPWYTQVFNMIIKSCAQDIISGSVNSIVNNYVHSLVDDCQLQTACFVHELILIRDSALELTNDVHLSREELNTCIQLLCTD